MDTNIELTNNGFVTGERGPFETVTPADAALVLEGGGMRGVFTAGALDFLMENELYFRECYAVSAGACHACSYLSHQHGRAYAVCADYISDERYCSVSSLRKTGDMFGVKFIYDTVPNTLNMYDYDTFMNNPTKFYAVMTDCKTGDAVYHQISDLRRDMDYIRASSSLPVVSRMVNIDGGEYLDGGISDSIPLRRSISAGNVKNVLILTQHDGFRKHQTASLVAAKLRYREYPRLVRRIETRYVCYNDTLDYIARLERAGEIFVIRPSAPLGLSRFEKDKDKLYGAYKAGYDRAKQLYNGLKVYLAKDYS